MQITLTTNDGKVIAEYLNVRIVTDKITGKTFVAYTDDFEDESVNSDLTEQLLYDISKYTD